MGTFSGGTFGGPGGDSAAGGGAYSISDILYHALRKARVTGGPGRGPSIDQIGDAFALFKFLLDLWRAQRLTRLNVSRNVFALTASTASYSIGPTGAFVTNTRPSRLEYVGLVDVTSGCERPIEIYTVQRWREIALKSLVSIPAGIRYQPTVPNGSITCYPVPSQADSLALYTWDTSADPGSATESLDLSPGYASALIAQLALDCIETFGTEALFSAKGFERLEKSARAAKAAIVSLNAPRPPQMNVNQLGRGGWFDIRTGMNR